MATGYHNNKMNISSNAVKSPILQLPGQQDRNQSSTKNNFLTPTLMRPCRSPSPSLFQPLRLARSANRSENTLQPPNAFGHMPRRPSPSSPRNTQDRLIPSRSHTNIKLAQYLLSPLSAHRRSNTDGNDDGGEDGQTVTRILNFGGKAAGSSRLDRQKPLGLVAPGTGRTAGKNGKSKFKISSKPDRVMAAPGTFLECGYQSAHWAPSSNLVVALESGVYVCKINEDCNVVEIRNNISNPDDPFVHVIWNAEGAAVICGKLNGDVELVDLRQHGQRAEWQLKSNRMIRSIALEQQHLLTCGGSGVRIYDLRQSGNGLTESMLSFRSRSYVHSLAWSPNGHLLAGGCESGLVYLWDVRNPAKPMTLLKNQEKNPVQGQIDCASEITGIQFNSQLRQVATSHRSLLEDTAAAVGAGDSQSNYGTDSSVQLWQLGSHKLTPLLELGQHEEGIVSMASSPDNHQLLTMGGDELLCLWRWSENDHQSAAFQAGSQKTRSLLDPTNLLR